MTLILLAGFEKTLNTFRHNFVVAPTELTVIRPHAVHDGRR
jgi:hypothetical protein